MTYFYVFYYVLYNYTKYIQLSGYSLSVDRTIPDTWELIKEQTVAQRTDKVDFSTQNSVALQLFQGWMVPVKNKCLISAQTTFYCINIANHNSSVFFRSFELTLTKVHKAQCTKMKFSIKEFFSKCDQIRSFLRIWSHLLEKSLMENFIFLCRSCEVFIYTMYTNGIVVQKHSLHDIYQ